MISSSPSRPKVIPDRLGIIVSGVCLVHCLVFPWLALAAPAMALIASDGWHQLLLLLAASSAFIAFIPSFKAPKLPKAILLLALTGVVLMASGLIWNDFERSLTIAGSLLLVCAHIVNLRAHRRAHQASLVCCPCPSGKENHE